MGLQFQGFALYDSCVKQCSHQPGAIVLKHLLILTFVLPMIIARQTMAQSADSLVRSLADPDPSGRAAAERNIRELAADPAKAPAVRQALIEASRDGGPAVSTSAARVLLSLPWDLPTDPAGIRSQLAAYSKVAEVGRMGLIRQMAQKPGEIAWPTLLRLLGEEPSEEVCWVIASQFHARSVPRTGIAPKRPDSVDFVASDALIEMVRQKLADPGDRGSALIMAARAWESKDRDKSLQFYQRAIDAEQQHATQDHNELDEAYDILAMNAIGQRQFDRAADILRMQCNRLSATPNPEDLSPIFSLFILHSRYGPVQGFAGDLQSYAAYTGSPEVLYALSRIYSRAGRAMESLSLSQAAAAAGFDVEGRYLRMLWLMQLNWSDYARQEASAILSTTEPDLARMRSDVELRIAHLAADEDNFPAALDHVQAAIKLDGSELTNSGKAQIAFLKAKIAQQQKDDAALKQNLADLVELNPQNYDLVIKSTPLLKSIGRESDAVRLFNERFETEKKNLEGRSDAEDLNNIAWLCSRCDQRLPEALEYAKRAVAIDPDNAAYIDTLADVHFQLGQVEEAIRLESRALLFRPEDAFMYKQLERFKAGRLK